MPKDLVSDFEPEEAEVAADDPAKDITLEDMGEDKELNTPPEDEKEEGPDQEEPEEGKSEEADEVAKPEAAKAVETEQKQTAEQAAQKVEVDKTTEEILKHLGMDSTLKIKGKEYKLSDFGKDDLLTYINKGVRFTQLTQELSKKEALVAEREKTAEANAVEATKILSQYRQAPGPTGKVETEPPKELQPTEYDDESTKATKQIGLTMWKQAQDVTQRLNAIEGGIQRQQTEAETDRVMSEINAHRADYPLSSIEEMIAIHALRPNIPLNELARRSHAVYGSIDHVKEVFKHAPEVRKAIEDEIVSAYLARNSKAKVIPQKPSVQGSRPAPAAKVKITSMDSAGQAAKKAFARMIEQQEGDND